MTTVRRSRTALSIAMFSLAFFLFSQALFAATVYTNAHPVARVTKPVNDGKRVVLHGHVPRVIANGSITGKAIDMGPIDPNTPHARHADLSCSPVPSSRANCAALSTSSRTNGRATFISGSRPKSLAIPSVCMTPTSSK